MDCGFVTVPIFCTRFLNFYQTQLSITPTKYR
uniref:Uncharacterized protein n=1 Tax=Rhizophora mucronata TaxID=61149 RepID=A0A2P2LZL0_RHIMU